MLFSYPPSGATKKEGSHPPPLFLQTSRGVLRGNPKKRGVIPPIPPPPPPNVPLVRGVPCMIRGGCTWDVMIRIVW